MSNAILDNSIILRTQNSSLKPKSVLYFHSKQHTVSLILQSFKTSWTLPNFSSKLRFCFYDITVQRLYRLCLYVFDCWVWQKKTMTTSTCLSLKNVLITQQRKKVAFEFIKWPCVCVCVQACVRACMHACVT